MIPLLIVAVLLQPRIHTWTKSRVFRSQTPHQRENKEGIDVRTVTEYRAGHYPRALHIPVDKIDEKTTTELPKKDYSSTATLDKGPDLRQRN